MWRSPSGKEEDPDLRVHAPSIVPVPRATVKEGGLRTRGAGRGEAGTVARMTLSEADLRTKVAELGPFLHRVELPTG